MFVFNLFIQGISPFLSSPSLCCVLNMSTFSTILLLIANVLGRDDDDNDDRHQRHHYGINFRRRHSDVLHGILRKLLNTYQSLLGNVLK